MIGLEKTTIRAVGLEQGELAGQTVVVTGSGRGIGRETALTFAWLGASVVVAELSDEGLETERLIVEAGGDACFVRTDVSSEAEVDRLMRITQETFGPASILVNNAIVCPVGSVLDTDTATWDRVMAVNLRGTFLTCRAFLPDMLERKRGTIVNMVSAEAMPYLSAYIASKQGIAAFSQSLAAEVGETGVRVIPFGVGMVDTPGIRRVAQELAPHLGLTRDQFLEVSLHAAYEGLMPAVHAAVAVVYLTVALADEYHGEIVDGYTVLERAGLIDTPKVAVETLEVAPAVHLDGAQALQQALSLSRRLRDILIETEAEFEQLPFFARPMARRGFKARAGQSVQEWKRTTDLLTERLSNMVDSDPTAATPLRASCPDFGERLNKLIVYYAKVPDETARFTKDAGILRQVAETSAGRVASIRSLISSLEGIV